MSRSNELVRRITEKQNKKKIMPARRPDLEYLKAVGRLADGTSMISASLLYNSVATLRVVFAGNQAQFIAMNRAIAVNGLRANYQSRVSVSMRSSKLLVIMKNPDPLERWSSVIDEQRVITNKN